MLRLFLGHHIFHFSTHKEPITQQGVWQADPQFHVIMWDSLTILFKASHFSTHQAQPPALSKINYVIIAIILQLKRLIWADICYCGIQKASGSVFQRAGFVWSDWLMWKHMLCNIEGKTKPFQGAGDLQSQGGAAQSGTVNYACSFSKLWLSVHHLVSCSKSTQTTDQ